MLCGRIRVSRVSLCVDCVDCVGYCGVSVEIIFKMALIVDSYLLYYTLMWYLHIILIWLYYITLHSEIQHYELQRDRPKRVTRSFGLNHLLKSFS